MEERGMGNTKAKELSCTKVAAWHFVLKTTMLFALFWVMVCFLALGHPVHAQAASYRMIDPNDFYPSKTVRSGKYYLKTNSKQVVLISSSPKGPFNKTTIDVGAGLVSNGTQCYYIKSGKTAYHDKLYRYVYSSRKSYLVKDLSKSNTRPGYSWIMGLCGNNLCIQVSDTASYDDVYFYNINSKKYKLACRNCCVSNHYKNYIVATSLGPRDMGIGCEKLTLYKVNGMSLKKIKVLAARGGYDTVYTGGYLYYVSYANEYMTKASFYRCKADGQSPKKLFTVKTSDDDIIIFETITSKYCEYSYDNYIYRYDYATKRTTKKRSW